MCGIYGGFGISSTSLDHIDYLSTLMSHRGPDAFNYHADSINDIFLAHSRLSIIDLSSAGNQPMVDSLNGNIISFNGEIYNHHELRKILTDNGYSFSSNTDTEVLLKGYSFWGASILNKLNGMFAFAIWDSKEKSFFLARDRIGEKPLYYSFTNKKEFIFSSELLPLLTNHNVIRDINYSTLYHFMRTGYSLPNQSIIRNINKLLPGHFLYVNNKLDYSIKKYWDLNYYFFNKSSLSFDDSQLTLQKLLKSAVDLQSNCDVNFGVFLSGGIDSAIVTASLDNPVTTNTFCAGFNDPSFDERNAALDNSNHFGTSHKSFELDIDKFEDLIEPLMVLDEPFADISLFPMFRLARFAKQHSTVCLSGDGGDELFCGYSTYVADICFRIVRILPNKLIRLISSLCKFIPTSFSSVSFDYKVKAFFNAATDIFENAHQNWRIIFSNSEISTLLRLSNSDIASLEEKFSQANLDIWKESEDLHFLDRAMHFDIKTWLPNDILYKVDRMSMANSLETRSPFLDHRVVEFAASLPIEYKIKKFEGKFILKSILLKFYNMDFFKSKKRGFGAPLSTWIVKFKLDIYKFISLTNFFDNKLIAQILTDHCNKKSNNGFKIIVLLSFCVWKKSINNVKTF
jgi:asparagine synthase (glutamine-hydrolysing)